MVETSGIITFTLWYIAIAYNYFVGTLPSEEMRQAAAAAAAAPPPAAAPGQPPPPPPPPK